VNRKVLCVALGKVPTPNLLLSTILTQKVKLLSIGITFRGTLLLVAINNLLLLPNKITAVKAADIRPMTFDRCVQILLA
jgi:hypothetical protein